MFYKLKKINRKIKDNPAEQKKILKAQSHITKGKNN